MWETATAFLSLFCFYFLYKSILDSLWIVDGDRDE